MGFYAGLGILFLFFSGQALNAATNVPGNLRGDWPVYSADKSGSKYSSLTQINRSNVHKLKLAWTFRTADMRARPATTIECNPLVVRGVMYITSPGLKAVALHAATGEKIWEFDPFAGKGGRGVNRGVTYWAQDTDERIFLVAGTFLYAINAKTGRSIDSFGQHGQIDLREELDRDVFFLPVSATTPGIIYQDLLILGSIVGEGPDPAAPGHIRAFDVRTGQRRWIFHTIPHPGEPGYETWPPDAWKTIGGANCWGGFTLDVDRGLVFGGTGSPSYDHYGGNRPGANLYANCVLALQATTGKLKWHFQTVHHDLWDYDLPCPPNLVSVLRDGRRIDAVAQVTKTGMVFVLDRDTGHPLFPMEERPVPASELPGEKTWPTQPFPLKPPPYAQQRFTTNEITDLSPAAHSAVAAKLSGMKTGDVFIPPGLRASVTLPQFNGGTDWGGAAYDPETHTLYVNSSNEAEWISMLPSTPKAEISRSDLGEMLYGAICSNCHGIGNPRNPASPSLASLKAVRMRLSRADALKLLETGRGQMPSFASLSETERDAVIAFLYEERSEQKIRIKDLNLSFAQEIPYVATGHNIFRDPDGYPANRRPWGTINAIDLNEGTIKWQTPLGTYPELEKKGLPPTGTFNMGGPIATAGGIIFIGGAMDERFHAYDKQSGKLLWEFQMDAGGYATPSTYEIDGKQYVVIAAGGGGKPETKAGNAFYCFALP